jgi:DNA-binding response OmpR family regulator
MDTNDQAASAYRILLAHAPEKIGFLVDALRGYEVMQAGTLKEAERLTIEDGINLFIVGIHFDDSRAMQLITTIRLDEHHKTTPIVVVRLSASEHTEMLRMTLDTLVKLNIINEFIEFEKHGKNQKLLFRKLVDQILRSPVPVA